MVIANYGTGTAEEAADWVRYANVTKGYGVKYWEIGNENYGNGHYGAAWEADNHADKSPAEYANQVVAYADAMKAVDPTIKIGAVLTTPGNWPDGIVAGGDAGTWNQTVLSIAGPTIDFVILHWYPGGSRPPSRWPSRPGRRRRPSCRASRSPGTPAPNADRIGIALTEINVGVGHEHPAGRAVRRRRLRDAAGAAASSPSTGGTSTTASAPCRTVAGQTDYGDFGLLSSGTCTADGIGLRAAAEHAVRAVPRADA